MRSPAELWENSIPVTGMAHAKALGQDWLGALDKRQGGLCVWSRVGETERGRRGGQGGAGQVMQGLGGCREDSGHSGTGPSLTLWGR